MGSKRKAKQRLTKLRVNEVSLVDTPANDQEFLVVKRVTEESPMQTQTGSASPDKLAEITKGIASLNLLLEGLGGDGDETGTEGDVNKAAADAAEGDADGKAGDAEVEKAGKKGEKPAFMKGEEADDIRKQLKTLQDKLAALGDKPTAKAAESDLGSIGVDPTTGAIVIKGGKQFSTKRMEALRKAFATLGSIMKEVDPDSVSALLDGGSATVAKSAAKDGGDDKLAEVLKAVTALGDRLGKLETTEAVTKDAGADNANENPNDKTVVKSVAGDANFWKGSGL